jgi:hypothetical protein
MINFNVNNAKIFGPIKFDLTNKKFYIKVEMSSRVGSRPANLPFPARWSKDEAGRQVKGVASVNIIF